MSRRVGFVLREAVNWINGSTLLGLAIAKVGRADLDRRHTGIWHATGYQGPNSKHTFTVGNVVLYAGTPQSLRQRHQLRDHEAHHSTQWACLGPLFLPLYYAEALMSLVTTGDYATGNAFEIGAGLRTGGYSRPALSRRAR